MNTSFKIPCVILCGGKSSRMGEDKSLLPFDSTNTLTQYQFNKLKPFFTNVYISSKTNKFDFLEDETSLILDEGEIYSPIVALESILKGLKGDKVFIITVDTPLVTIDSIRKIIDSSWDFDICVGETKRTHNLCGVFSVNVLNTISEMLSSDIHKVGYLLKQSNTNIVRLEHDDEFINLNNKDEYLKALELIKN